MYFILFEGLSKSISFVLFTEQVRLTLVPCQFSLSLSELLMNISQIQQRILKCITLPQILCQYQNQWRSARFKKSHSVGEISQQKIKMLQVFGLLFL